VTSQNDVEFKSMNDNNIQRDISHISFTHKSPMNKTFNICMSPIYYKTIKKNDSKYKDYLKLDNIQVSGYRNLSYNIRSD
jgi:hypothetical protein